MIINWKKINRYTELTILFCIAIVGVLCLLMGIVCRELFEFVMGASAIYLAYYYWKEINKNKSKAKKTKRFNNKRGKHYANK